MTTFSPCPLEDVSQAFLEAVAEEKPHVKPYFSKTIRDLEVVEGSAARFDCKIEGKQRPCSSSHTPGWPRSSCVTWQVWAATVGTARP